MMDKEKMFHKFVAEFTDRNLEPFWKNNEALQFSGLLDHMKDNPDVHRLGIFFGETKGKHFQASLPLLEELSAHSNKKAIIDSEAEWLFLCGRDVFGEHIRSAAPTASGFVLVENELGENLGLGKMGPGGSITNIIDRGDYLRREKRSK